MFFVTILIKNTACRITPIYRLEAGSGGAGGGEPGGGGAGGGGAGGGGAGSGGAGGGGAGGGGAGGGGGWRIIYISNLHKALIYQQLTESPYISATYKIRFLFYLRYKKLGFWRYFKSPLV